MATSASIVSSLPRPARWALGAFAAIVAMALVLFLVLLVFPWNALREPIANYFSEKTGRKVAIAGDLTVKLAWHPWIDVRGIAISNAPWSDQPVMASVERLGMRVEPLSYFTRLRIPEIELQGPRAILERNADGVERNRVRDGASNRREHRADLLMVTRMVGTGQAIRFAAATAKMRNHAAPAGACSSYQQRTCVMRVGAALEAVEHDDDRRIRRWHIEPVEVPEVAVRGCDALASKLDGWATQPIRPDRLRVPAGQPTRRAIRLGRDEDVGGLVVALREPPRRTAPHGMNQAATPCSRASFVRFS